MVTETPENKNDGERAEREAQRRHARGNAWISFGAPVLTALITLVGTLAGLFFAPTGIARTIAPNAAVTETVTHTVTSTVTATPAVTITVTPDSEVTTEPASGTVGSAVYLGDLSDKVTAYQGGYGHGSYSINGHDYVHSVGLEVGSVGYTRWVEYTIDGSYTTFKGDLGLNDELATDSVVEFAIYGNGKLLKKLSVRYAKPVPVTVPISGLVKLRIAATRTSGGTGNGSEGAVFGDASLTP
ncbi:NPCBM/NEW2 domain-containing protein [Sphaerisporangium perillae]|uniref:NPCBM/NEW2 domain-containing protein n=1 Tax=Sphaerisporangium perillae TaxID=2935860 RepID=UPI00200D404C|nr:NPCBM/NEW2 domain-containing protein [Sphaerisporangium perillae]